MYKNYSTEEIASSESNDTYSFFFISTKYAEYSSFLISECWECNTRLY
jgi:hypothetical protein